MIARIWHSYTNPDTQMPMKRCSSQSCFPELAGSLDTRAAICAEETWAMRSNSSQSCSGIRLKRYAPWPAPDCETAVIPEELQQSPRFGGTRPSRVSLDRWTRRERAGFSCYHERSVRRPNLEELRAAKPATA
jgi:hypothetical protein